MQFIDSSRRNLKETTNSNIYLTENQILDLGDKN